MSTEAEVVKVVEDSEELLRVERSLLRREYIAQNAGAITFFVLFSLAAVAVALLLS